MSSLENIFIFIGRPDGLGNRIEQLIGIQEFCFVNNKKCIYIWKNSHNTRIYDILIRFDNITIKSEITDEERNKYDIISNCFQRSYNFCPKYQFKFNIVNNINYDVIIHIRAGDRLQKTKSPGKDFSNIEQLNDFITKTINFINKERNITTYSIVTDDNKYYNIKDKINKKFTPLLYDYDVPKDYIDFFYLTKPSKYIIMCSQFSSYSICASILGNKQLFVFKSSLNSNLPRYKANITIMDN
jgi:hypothetical protein